jgi:choline-sulfatase
VDDCIGELLDGLHKEGLLDNTIVIYTSDHGDMAGIQGMWGKCVPHDPSIGVPLLMTGPGITPGHRHVDTPVSLMDLFPTMCGLAGLAIPEGLDGMDLSGMLSDPTISSPRDYAISTYMIYAVRVRGGWTVPEDEPCTAMRTVRERDWKYVEIEGGTPILFDMKNNPEETINLAGHPEHADRCAAMKARLFDGFSWAAARRQLAKDRTRIESFASGVKPTMPNQYMLSDGRVFDAEASLYEARWLHVPPVHGGGIIPQQFG